MEYFSLSKPGREWNEDACYACEKFAFVLDGATSLTKQKFSELNSDAEWSSNWWKEYLITALADESKLITDILKTGVKLYTKQFNALAKKETVIDFPSTTIAVVRRINKQLEVFVLGDSIILFKTKAGLVFEVQDSRLNVVDSTTISMLLDAASKEKSTLFEATKRHPKFVLEGRKKKNEKFGYYVLSDSVQAIDQGIYTYFEEKIFDKVYLLSDGFSQLFDTVKILSKEAVISKINSLKDAENLYTKLLKTQNKDKKGNKYPRFKLSDDATIVCLKF